MASAPAQRGQSDRRVLRLVEHPVVILREPGDRDTFAIPPSELTELARVMLAREPEMKRMDLKRRLAESLGWKRYSRPLDELLDEVLPSSVGD